MRTFGKYENKENGATHLLLTCSAGAKKVEIVDATKVRLVSDHSQLVFK